MRRALLSALLCLALSACASAAQGAQRFSGTFDWHFETSSFVTDSGEGPYWLSAEGAAWRQATAPIEASGRGPWGQVHLVIEGVLSAPGNHGHLGAYERELRVTRVIEARLIEASPH